MKSRQKHLEASSTWVANQRVPIGGTLTELPGPLEAIWASHLEMEAQARLTNRCQQLDSINSDSLRAGRSSQVGLARNFRLGVALVGLISELKWRDTIWIGELGKEFQIWPPNFIFNSYLGTSSIRMGVCHSGRRAKPERFGGVSGCRNVARAQLSDEWSEKREQKWHSDLKRIRPRRRYSHLLSRLVSFVKLYANQWLNLFKSLPFWSLRIELDRGFIHILARRMEKL